MPIGQAKQNGWTKHGIQRRNPTRQAYRHHWTELRARLQIHLAECPHGEAARIAKHLGVQQSLIHRYCCPICEHDTEPRYSFGCALDTYLTQYALEDNNPVSCRRTIFQTVRRKRSLKLVEVIREGCDWSTIPLN